VSEGLKLIKEGNENPNFKDTLINLETEDYEINDGILTRIPRKTELDKLIANVRKIDKKAAKWMTKNRHKLEDVDDLFYCFDWKDHPKHDWFDIYEKLEEMAEREPAKGILKYRVARFGNKTITINTKERENEIQSLRGFNEWLTDWIEV
jgi:hypothetical protein